MKLRIRFERGHWKVFKMRGIMWFAIGAGRSIPDAWQAAKNNKFEIHSWTAARSLHR